MKILPKRTHNNQTSTATSQ